MDTFSITSLFKKRNKKALIFLLTVILVLMLLLSIFTLSPQWCLSKERVWKAEEADLYIYVSEDYQTELYECFSLFNREELKEYVTGELTINGKVFPFTFKGEDQFRWIRFGNDSASDESSEDIWTVTGVFSRVFNCKKLEFSIVGIYGEDVLQGIERLTLVPVDNTGEE